MNSSKTDSEVAECEISSNIKLNFTQQPNYRQVYKNLDYSTTYDILFANGNVKDKTVGYKQLISYPYDDYMFSKGDYIHMTYGGELTTWLLITLDTTALYDVKGRIEQCNNTMKWQDSNGVTMSYPCVIQDEIREDRIRGNKTITLPDGYITVYVQENEHTGNLKINKRFIFNGTAYEIRSLINYADTGLIRFIMVKDTENSETDDLVNNIADVNESSYTITILEDSFDQEVGYTSTLNYNLSLNGEVSTKDVEWISSDDSIATINSSTGAIELLSLGSVTFTVRMTDNTDVSDNISINVVGSLPSTDDNIISPDISNIFQGETQTYNVYNYTDNVQTADTFTIVASGADSDKYTLTIIDGNSFSVKSLGYSSDILTITCTNNIDASVVIGQIKLKGLW
jgi:hypothetical protein